MNERIVVLVGRVHVKLHDGLVTLCVIDGHDIAVAELDYNDVRQAIALLETAKLALETQITNTGV